MIRVARKTELIMVNITKLKHSNKNIKRIKRFITIKDTKKQTKETVKELEIKRRERNYPMDLSKFKPEEPLEINKLEKLNSPKSPRKKGTKNIFIDNYQYYESKVIKRKKPIIIDGKIHKIKSKKKCQVKSPNCSLNLTKKSPFIITGRPNYPFQRNKSGMIKCTSKTNIKTSPSKLCNTANITTNIKRINQNQTTINWRFGEDRLKKNQKNENAFNLVRKDEIPKRSQNKNEILDNMNLKRTNQPKNDDKISYPKILDEQSGTSTSDSEYRGKRNQEKKDEEPITEKKGNTIITVENKSRRNNHKKKKVLEYKSKRKIKNKKNGSLSTKSKNDNYESFRNVINTTSTTHRTKKHKSINLSNSSKIHTFIYSPLNIDSDNQLLNSNFQFQDEYTEIINHEKIYFLTKEITDFYNNYIGICEKGILIDQKKYPLSECPKISVIIPLYNAIKFLHYSLRSVQNQKMKEIEIILVDDYSTDDTLLLVNKYMKEDPRIRLIKNNENRKILYSKSIGALNAKGKYILELDQDDLFIRDDLFDILYNEAENNNLDLIQIKDITTNELYIANKTRVNTHRRYQINSGKSFKPMLTHYETNEQLKNKLFIDGYVFTLWGLLIKSDLYKKAIYSLWPVILNYKFTYYEDYLMTTIIIAFSKHHKFLNNFGLLHIKHRSSAMFVYSEYLFTYLLLFVNVLYKYYIKYDHPEDIIIILNLLKKYSCSYKDYYEKYPEIFKESMLQILSNEYLTDIDANLIREELEIKIEDFKCWNSYEYLMNSDEFFKLSNFQNSIIDNARIISNVNKIIISIIIYCNEFKYLTNTINSIEKQNFTEFEIIIIYDNDESSDLNLIEDYIKCQHNISLINNHIKKGILFSYSSGVLASKGDFILLLKQGETLAKDNILNNLYNEIKKDKYDILEFNLLINNCDTIKNNSLSLYRCTHFESYTNNEFIKYDRNYINLDQEKDVLTNKLIKSSFFKSVINKYKIINNQEIIYN